jgi:hypothetical protein
MYEDQAPTNTKTVSSRKKWSIISSFTTYDLFQRQGFQGYFSPSYGSAQPWHIPESRHLETNWDLTLTSFWNKRNLGIVKDLQLHL